METTVKDEGGVVLVTLDGRLDTAQAVECEKDFQPLLQQADQQIVIDCTRLEYISSSGLRLLLTLRKAVEEKGGHLTIEHINDDIRNVFTLTGFFTLFDIRA